MTRTRVLVVDDSPLLRQVFGDLLQGQPDIEVVGFARDGQEAIHLASKLKPDVITLDIEMPRMSGLEALSAIMTIAPARVIMVSVQTSQGVQAALEALDRGAIDFVCKPRSGSAAALREVRDELTEKIRSARQVVLGRRLRHGVPAVAPSKGSDRILLIAASTGGPKALTCLFETLPRELPLPVVILQHMPAGFTGGLARRLDKIGRLPCREAQEGDRPEAGLALLAPGGRSVSLAANGDLEIHDARPSADVLFSSAADIFGSRCLAAILTGMGNDGTQGALDIRRAGGQVFAESEHTCSIYGMARSAKDAGAIDGEYPIYEIGHALVALISRKAARVA